MISGIQEHNKKEVVILPADKTHWTKELLEEVHNDISLKKVYKNIPELKNFIFEN
ncbi:MAG: hypothetical protein Q7R52_01595 [archaeon]|nr:hypothetical protein [archaeon]